MTRRDIAGNVGVPFGARRLGFGRPVDGRAVARKGRVRIESVQGKPGVANDGQGQVFARVVPADVERDQPGVVAESRPGPRREVLKSGPDGEDNVGILGDDVGAVGSRYADRTYVQRVRRQEVGTTCDRLDDRNAARLGERRQLGDRPRILDAAPGNDDRTPGGG